MKIRWRAMAWMAAAIALGCGGSNGSPADGATSGDADAGDGSADDVDGDVGGGTPDGGGTSDAGDDGSSNPPDAVADAEPVERNPLCGGFDDGVYGTKLPWNGFTYEGETYTCNRCRGGDPNLQGAWRFMDFDTEDPTLPLSGGYAERLIFEGNTWEQRSAGQDLGSFVDVQIDGWYFCGDAPELDNQAKVFVVTRTDPEGGFGWESGLAYTGVTLMQGSDKIAIQYFEGINEGTSYYALYCRIGTIIETLKGKDVPCEDPFE